MMIPSTCTKVRVRNPVNATFPCLCMCINGAAECSNVNDKRPRVIAQYHSLPFIRSSTIQFFCYSVIHGRRFKLFCSQSGSFFTLINCFVLKVLVQTVLFSKLVKTWPVHFYNWYVRSNHFLLSKRFIRYSPLNAEFGNRFFSHLL